MSVSFEHVATTSDGTTIGRRFIHILLLLGPCFLSLISLAHGEDAQQIVFLREWGKHGTEPGQFDFPIAIAVSKSDEVFVTDHLNHRIQKFDTKGKLLQQFTVLPTLVESFSTQVETYI